MPAFSINEGVFQIPDGWEDKSITALSFPKGAPIPSASVTVTREILTDSQVTLAVYVDSQLARLAKTCSVFRLIQRNDVTLNGDPAQVLDFSWKTPEGVHVHQLMIVLFWNGQSSLVFTYTSTVDKFAEYQPLFHDIVGSFQVRR